MHHEFISVCRKGKIVLPLPPQLGRRPSMASLNGWQPDGTIAIQEDKYRFVHVSCNIDEKGAQKIFILKA